MASKKGYIGVNDKARLIKKIYIGVNGKARKVKKAYIGVNGKARLWYTSTVNIPATRMTISGANDTVYTNSTNYFYVNVYPKNCTKIPYISTDFGYAYGSASLDDTPTVYGDYIRYRVNVYGRYDSFTETSDYCTVAVSNSEDDSTSLATNARMYFKKRGRKPYVVRSVVYLDQDGSEILDGIVADAKVVYADGFYQQWGSWTGGNYLTWYTSPDPSVNTTKQSHHQNAKNNIHIGDTHYYSTLE